MNQALHSVRTFRLAGICYLIIIVCGVSSEVILRGPLIDYNSAANTAKAVNTEHLRFRFSILADIVMALADTTLALLLFWIFRGISFQLAMGALVFRLLQSGLIAASLLYLQQASLLLHSVSMPGNQALALSFIELHAYGYDLGLIFFAVNCFFTSVLLYRSNLIPRILSIGIALSGMVYLSGSIVRFLAPEVHEFVAPAYLLPLIAETAFCLWLLFSSGPSKHAQID